MAKVLVTGDAGFIGSHLVDELINEGYRVRVLEVLGDGTQIRSYIYVTDAVEATILAWKNAKENYEVYNVAAEDWITVNEVAEIILRELNLNNARVIHKPILHGIGWPEDVKRITLNIDKLKAFSFRPRYSSIDTVRLTVKELTKEIL